MTRKIGRVHFPKVMKIILIIFKSTKADKREKKAGILVLFFKNKLVNHWQEQESGG